MDKNHKEVLMTNESMQKSGELSKHHPEKNNHLGTFLTNKLE